MTKKKPVFKLKPEHISLVSILNFTVDTADEYDGKYIPCISRKRPFGNSSSVHSVLERLGIAPGPDGNYTDRQIMMAENLILGLPCALEVITRFRTFAPGTYAINPSGSYFQYCTLKKSRKFKKPLSEIDELAITEHEKNIAAVIRDHCMNISSIKPQCPYEEAISWLKSHEQNPFMEKAAIIMEKYKNNM